MARTFRRRAKLRVLSSREVYRGPIFWVTSDRIIEPTGVQVRRDIVGHPGSVVILAVEESGDEPRVLLEKQYRYTVRDDLLELPAGRIDEGESELAAAKRELIEETGYRAARWKRILRFWASPGFVAETMAVYLARGLHPGPARPEADEVIAQRLVPLSQAVQMVMRGRIRDAKTMTSILWLSEYQNRQKPRK